jgi:hypothetical protein
MDVSKATGSIEWSEVRVRPGATPALPDEGDLSHYYAARETDASIVRVGDQHEKFLFYRGLASFPVPVSVKSSADGSVEVSNTGPRESGDMILFENYDGRVAFRVLGRVKEKDSTRVFRPTSGDLASLHKTLQELLVANGLYRREAEAMLETWRDSWFTEGTRLFYLLPQAAVDEILPLQIDPKPAQLARVFVGRIEVITPATENAVIDAIHKNKGVALSQHSRFLVPIVQRILSTRPAELDQASAQLALSTISAWRASAEKTCR